MKPLQSCRRRSRSFRVCVALPNSLCAQRQNNRIEIKCRHKRLQTLARTHTDMLKPLLYHFFKFLNCLSEAQWLPRKSIVAVNMQVPGPGGRARSCIFSYLPKYTLFTAMVMPRRERNAAMVVGSRYTSGDGAKGSTAETAGVGGMRNAGNHFLLPCAWSGSLGEPCSTAETVSQRPVIQGVAGTPSQ